MTNRAAAIRIIKHLRRNDFEALLAGGCDPLELGLGYGCHWGGSLSYRTGTGISVPIFSQGARGVKGSPPHDNAMRA